MRPVTVLLALVLTSGGVAACGEKTGTVAPDAALRKAVHALETTAHTFTVKQGSPGKYGNARQSTGSGSVDPAAKTGMITITTTDHDETVALAWTVVAPDLWLKVDTRNTDTSLGLDPTVWWEIDRSRLDPDEPTPVDDAGAPRFGLVNLFKDGLRDVKRVDARKFSGTVEITDWKNLMEPSLDAMAYARNSDKPILFTATVDEQGRLTAFTIDGGSIDSELVYEMTFADFGAVPPVSKPTGAKPADEAVYRLFE
ncbi:hypothetical protein [Dactylosporangium aurantiacum]|uniref:hypothetical protein n=1 Tax=Dactylosporangium aurantiacum TaxID=35754 RepID=UPI0012DEDD60|nr:hypothetical protein [Dactylosporangium aurantiacum]MDG6110245.1 hypothetical protein [Dactylosporangium aurantiacum]